MIPEAVPCDAVQDADAGDLFRVYTCFLCYFSTVGGQVAALIRFLIESSPTIFGDEVESAFAALLNTSQETDDLAGQPSFSDTMERNQRELNSIIFLCERFLAEGRSLCALYVVDSRCLEGLGQGVVLDCWL